MLLQKKVCMLGAHGVGKRSLTSTCEQPFAGQYATSVGVRICRKILEIDGRSLTLTIWDIADIDGFKWLQGYLRGMNGYLLVADGTRPETVQRVRDIFGQIWSFEQPQAASQDSASYVQFPYRKPFLLLLNKCDLTEEWKVEKSFLEILFNKGWPVEVVSAKENRGVEEAFLRLAREMLALQTTGK